MYLQVGGTLQVSVDNEVMVLAARRVVLGGIRVVKTKVPPSTCLMEPGSEQWLLM